MSRKTLFSLMLCGSGGSKSRFAKSDGCGAIWSYERSMLAQPCGAKHILKAKSTTHLGAFRSACTFWREARFEVKMCKGHRCWSTFVSLDAEKVNAVVAQRQFRSVSNTTCSEHFWRWMSEKCARLRQKTDFD